MSEATEGVDSANAWRTETPGCAGWPRTARPDDANKYFMVSADGHVQEPSDLWAKRMDESFKDRLPGVIMDGKGNKLQKTEGFSAAAAAEHQVRRRRSAPQPVRQNARSPGSGSGAGWGGSGNPFPEQRSHHLGNAGPGFFSRHVPGLQRLGLGRVRRFQ